MKETTVTYRCDFCGKELQQGQWVLTWRGFKLGEEPGEPVVHLCNRVCGIAFLEWQSRPPRTDPMAYRERAQGVR